MKKILTLLLLLSSFSYGAITIPKHVYSIEKLDDAKTKAKEKGKPLAFVYTDPGST